MRRSPPAIAFVFMIIGMALQLIWHARPSSYIFTLSQIFILLFLGIMLIYGIRNSPPMKRIQFGIVAIVMAILASSLLGAFVFRDSIDRLIHSLGIYNYNDFLPWVIAALLLVCLVWFIIASLKPKTK